MSRLVVSPWPYPCPCFLGDMGSIVETNQHRKNSTSDSDENGDLDDEWKNSSKEEKATKIFRLLKAKNFVVLLDDIWERLDLLEVGIPLLNDQTKSKILLTTLSERVCDDLEVHTRLKVECLTPDEAFSLFYDKADENLLNSYPDTKRLARIVVQESRGLPLALIVIGRSMASRKTPRDWEQAIEALKIYPAKFPGKGDHVFSILKISYDHLDDDIIKLCFLYCSIFPEDRSIRNEDLSYGAYGIGANLPNITTHTYLSQDNENQVLRIELYHTL